MMIDKGELKMSVIYKSKTESRAESEKALAEFLARGGVIEVVKSRKAPKSKMRAKSTRVVSGHTNLGFRTSKVFGG